MVLATNLGFPRIGAKRELKKALESYWAKEISKEELYKAGAELRAINWKLQQDAELAHIPSNDFTYYDHVLATSVLVGGLFLAIDAAFWGANLVKIPHGGWFPLVIGAMVFTILTTWKKGRQVLAGRMRERTLPLDLFVRDILASELTP